MQPPIQHLSSPILQIRLSAVLYHAPRLRSSPTHSLRIYVHLAAIHDPSPLIRQCAASYADKQYAALCLLDPHPAVRKAALERVDPYIIQQHLTIEIHPAVILRALEVSSIHHMHVQHLLWHPDINVRNALTSPLANCGKYQLLAALLKYPTAQTALTALDKHPPPSLSETLVRHLLKLCQRETLAVQVLSHVPCATVRAYAILHTWLESSPHPEKWDSMFTKIVRLNENFCRVVDLTKSPSDKQWLRRGDASS